MKKHALKLMAFTLVAALTGCAKEDSFAPSSLSTAPRSLCELTADDILSVEIEPADFTAAIDNPYFPLRPGETYYYVNTSKEGPETETIYIESTVTCDTRLVMGVTTRVVHVVETDEEGNVLEVTDDWYAQDKCGNVWYFGEATVAYEEGMPSTEGSWEAGVDGARPGIIMWANPWDHVGETYYQEYYPGEAEDQATVLPSHRTVKVPYGVFHQVLTTEEFTALEPGAVERKSYVEGMGMVLAEGVKGDKEREELVEVSSDECP